MRRVSWFRSRPFRILLGVLFVVLLLWRPASAHLRAASLLARYIDPQNPGAIARFEAHPVDVHDLALPRARARIYLPTDIRHPPGMVLVHGVHFRGMDEPRLQRFAETIAASGVAVLTPEVRELCDYRIDPASIDTIGEAAQALSDKLGGARVGVMGLSFAGGLSLIAAADPRFAPRVAFVVAVGAHDDLGRVLRYFVSNEAPRPDGSVLRRHAHDYGTIVLVYSHVEDFFTPSDVPVARDALRAWLHESFDEARAIARSLSPEGAAKIEHVFAHDAGLLGPELEAEIERLQPAFAAVSPAAHLSGIRVPVFLLHGAGDALIPPSESEWLVRDTPPAMLREVLVSPAVEHVGLEEKTKIADEAALVHFMSSVLEEAQDTVSK